MKKTIRAYEFSFLLFLILCITPSFSFAQWESFSGPARAAGLTSLIGTVGNRAFVVQLEGISEYTPGGIYELMNGGRTARRIPGIEIPGNSSANFASDNHTIFLGIIGGIIISTDGGEHWETRSFSMFNTMMLTAELVKGDTLLASSGNNLYHSSDKGMSWDPVSGKSPENYNGARMILVDDFLLKADNVGVRKSINWGVSWATLTNVTFQVIDMLYDGSKLYFTSVADLYVSSDKGQSFAPANVGTTWLNTIAKRGSLLLVGSSYAPYLFQSTDEGASWTGIPGSLISGMVIKVAMTDSSEYAGTMDNIYYTPDHGQTWRETQGSHLPGTKLINEGSDLLCGTASGIFRGTSTGEDWQLLSASIPSNGTKDLIINNLQITTALDNGVYLLNNENSWECLGLTENSPVSLTGSGNDLMSGTLEEGLYYTNNNGQLWVSRNSGFPTQGSGKYYGIRALASNDTMTFASPDANGIYYSANRGLSWSKGAGITVDTVTCFLAYDSCWFAGSNKGVYTSTDGGMNWIKLPDLNISGTVTSLLFSHGHLIVGTTDAGVMLYMQNFQLWYMLTANLPDLNILSMVEQDDKLIVSTANHELLKRDFREILGGDTKEKAQIRIFPNPCRNFFKVELPSTHHEEVSYTIYDICGKPVGSGKIPITNESISIDISLLVRGIYFFTMNKDQLLAPQRIIKL